MSSPNLSSPIRTICCYCGVGCGIELQDSPSGELLLQGDKQHPGSHGALCSKGRTLHHTLRSYEGRVLEPTWQGGDKPQTLSWDQAMASISGHLGDLISSHGPESVFFYGSGQLLTEDYYTLTKLVKGFLGTNNIDTNSRLCMSSAVVAYVQSLGSDAVPGCYDDFDACDTLLVAGANPAWSHPIIWKRLVDRKAAGQGPRICVVDPRSTDSCAIADMHLQLAPGSDVALFHGLARQLRAIGGWDDTWLNQHADGLDDYLQAIEPWTLEATAAACDIAASDIAQLAEWLLEPKFLSCWTMGLNQSTVGVDKSRALINLHLVTGAIGKPGCGPFSLTGQPNAMGGRETGGMASLLPGHRNLGNAAQRQEVADFWGVESIPAQPGPTAVELLEAIESGRIKAVWVLATNPLASLPDSERVRRAFASLDLLVVQEPFVSETASLAHWLLPSTTWPEKTGTMTSSERRVALLQAARPAPGQARDDWRILADLATRLGHGHAFAWENAAAVFDEWVGLTKGRDCDMRGISHARLASQGPLQWPVPDAQHPGTPRLYQDARFATATGKAQLAACDYSLDHEATDAQHPLILTSGRLRDQWHYQTRSGRVAGLRQHAPIPILDIHPDDAQARSISDGDAVIIHNQRGRIQVEARISQQLRPGLISLPMHWSSHNAGWQAAINRLTSTRIDPYSKQPELKTAAVQVEAVPAWQGEMLVVGGGALARALVENWDQAGCGGRLSIIAEEAEGLYDRVQLPHLIDGTRQWQQLLLHDPQALAKRGVRFISARAQNIDRHQRQVTCDDGNTYSYDHLVLACGSSPRRCLPPKPEPGLRGIHALRRKADAEALIADASPGTSCAIIGAGLLGLEVADALISRGLEVHLLVRGESLMGKQLDPQASAILAAHLQARGMHIHWRSQVARCLGTPSPSSASPSPSAHVHHCSQSPTDTSQGHNHLSALETQDGQIIPCQLALEAVGTIANDAIARACGLPQAPGGGIAVDEALHTVDPHISAGGECASVAGQRYGTTAAASAMAQVILHQACGRLQRRFQGFQDANILKIHGFTCAAIGDTAGTHPDDQIVLCADPSQGYYQKRILRHGSLVGAICMGNADDFPSLCELVRSGVELDPDTRRQLLRPDSASSLAPPVEGPLVCSCMRIGADTIARLAPDCSTPQELCTKSKAGTGCGSCKPEVSRIWLEARESMDKPLGTPT